MSLFVWFLGFGLMMLSFGFLFGNSEDREQPRITVDPWWPDPDDSERR